MRFIGISAFIWQILGIIVNGIARYLFKPTVRFIFRIETNLSLSSARAILSKIFYDSAI
jgi:hypothetical protein